MGALIYDTREAFSVRSTKVGMSEPLSVERASAEVPRAFLCPYVKQQKFHNMGKYIIVITGKPDTGKTTVINNVWDLLPSFDGSGKRILSSSGSHEIVGICEPDPTQKCRILRDKKIGVNSIGDNSYEIQRGIIQLMLLDCDIIVCASRTPDLFNKAISNLPSMTINSLLSSWGVTPSILASIQQVILTNFDVLFYGNISVNIFGTYPSSSAPLPFNHHRLSAQYIVNIIENLI